MALSPTNKTSVRAHISKFCLAAEANEPSWHYSQQRPFRYIDNPSARGIVADCSGYVAIAYHDAMHELGIWLADPLGMRWTGFGNTWTEEAWLREHGKRIDPDAQPILVGDLARWGTGRHSHTAICRTKGSRQTAWFSSHGWEGGPVREHYDYRTDPVGIWRHPALL